MTKKGQKTMFIKINTAAELRLPFLVSPDGGFHRVVKLFCSAPIGGGQPRIVHIPAEFQGPVDRLPQRQSQTAIRGIFHRNL
jgi:hypothetical protein